MQSYSIPLIIAGSRSITNTPAIRGLITEVVEIHGRVGEIVTGYNPETKSPRGVDEIAYLWAVRNHYPYRLFPADWSNVSAAKAVIKYRYDGTPYNALAGFERNERMASYARALLLIWTGDPRTSPGSAPMRTTALNAGLLLTEYHVKPNEAPRCVCWWGKLDPSVLLMVRPFCIASWKYAKRP